MILSGTLEPAHLSQLNHENPISLFPLHWLFPQATERCEVQAQCGADQDHVSWVNREETRIQDQGQDSLVNRGETCPDPEFGPEYGPTSGIGPTVWYWPCNLFTSVCEFLF